MINKKETFGSSQQLLIRIPNLHISALFRSTKENIVLKGERTVKEVKRREQARALHCVLLLVFPKIKPLGFARGAFCKIYG